MTNLNDDFETFRGDLIAYLAGKLNLSPEDVTAKLGDLLVAQLASAAASRLANAERAEAAHLRPPLK